MYPLLLSRRKFNQFIPHQKVGRPTLRGEVCHRATAKVRSYYAAKRLARLVQSRGIVDAHQVEKLSPHTCPEPGTARLRGGSHIP